MILYKSKLEYKSKEKKLILDKFEKNKEYKIHIRTVINNSYSAWSKIKEFNGNNLSKRISKGLFSTFNLSSSIKETK